MATTLITRTRVAFAATVVLVSGLSAAHAQPVDSARVGAEADPVAAAVALSQAVFGDDAASAVVVGRSDVFADNLAGAAVGRGSGPLLYVPGGPDGELPAGVRSEIVRLLPEAGGDCDAVDAEVFLLGGDQALSTGIEQTLTSDGWCVERLAGDSRVQTALAAADRIVGGAIPTQVLLARADDWADAATGGAWSVAAGVPVLITPTDQLHPDVADWLSQRADPAATEIVLLGGTAALSQAVEDAARDLGQVRRVAGPARDATAAAIAGELWPEDVQSGAVTLVNGYADNGWTYALAGGVLAASQAAPELYVQADAVPPGTATWLDANPPTLVTAIGPTSAISDAVLAQASGAPPPGPSDELAYYGPNGDIRVANSDGTGDHAITASAVTGDKEAPASWAPDGSAVAFTAFGGVGVAYLDGRPEIVLPGTSGGIDPAWSPRADLIAFTGRGASGDFAAFVVAPDGTGLRQFGGDGLLVSHQPWSPSGERLVATSRADNSLQIVDVATGGTTSVATTQPFTAARWSPSGDTILLQQGPFDLSLISPDGTNLQPLAGFGVAGAASWSADGTQVASFAIVGDACEADGIFVIDVATGEARQVAEAFDECPKPPAFSPDGLRVAYSAGGIFEANVDGTEGHPISSGSAPSFRPAAPVAAEALQGRIAFTSAAYKPALYTIATNGTDLQRVSGPDSWTGPLALSPDGGALAFYGYPPGTTSDAEVMTASADGTGTHAVVQAGGKLHLDRVAWSPDGRYIAHTRYQTPTAASGRHELFLYDTVTGTDRQLSHVGNEEEQVFPQWSPDGSVIVMMSRHSVPNPDGVTYSVSTNTYLVPVDDSAAVELPRCFQFGGLSWSPSGQQLVATGPCGSTWPQGNLYLLNRDGTEGPTFSTRGSSPAWSPDGTVIAYSGEDGQLWTISPDGSGNRRVTDGGPPVLNPQWTADSRFITFTCGQCVGYVHVASGERTLLPVPFDVAGFAVALHV